MKTPTPRTLPNFLQAQGVSNSLQHNWPAQTTGKGNRKDCCLIKQEKNTPADPIIREGAFDQEAQWHNILPYGWSRLQTGQTGRGILYFLRISDQHYNAEGKFNLPWGDREGPEECSPLDKLSIHITRFYASGDVTDQTHATHVYKNINSTKSGVEQ